MQPVPRNLRCRPGRHVGYRMLLAAAAVAVAAAGCAKTPEQGDLVDSLMRAGLSKAEATCAASAVFDNLSDDQISAIAERGPSAVRDGADPDEPIDRARKKISECRNAHESPTTVTTSTTTPADGTTTTSPVDGAASNGSN